MIFKDISSATFKCVFSFAALLAIYLIIQMLAVANELTVPVKCA